MELGAEIQFHSYPEITPEMLKAYAQASGDFNPIHLDEEVAKKSGLPGIIAHGMFVAGLIAERAQKFIRENDLSGEYKQVYFQTRFKAMTLVKDTVSVGGVVKQLDDQILTLDLQARNQRNEVTTTAVAKFQRMI